VVPLTVRLPGDLVDPAYEARVVLHSVLATPWGDLPVLNTHLNHRAGGAYRRQELVGLLAELHRAVGTDGPVIVGGDFNFPPEYGTPPQVNRMLPHNRMNRLLDPHNPNSEPNRMVALELFNGGFFDVAAELHRRSVAAGAPDDRLLARTGQSDRIDWIAVSSHLREALIDYRRLDQPEDASDHYGITATLDLVRADTSNLWDYK
jgi:endonuclease/exonuclease/phosphatase family metal-dependent hydrolase